MAKKVNEAKEVKELEYFDGVREFISNGKSKHMANGAKFEVSYEMAKQFVQLGFGELV